MAEQPLTAEDYERLAKSVIVGHELCSELCPDACLFHRSAAALRSAAELARATSKQSLQVEVYEPFDTEARDSLLFQVAQWKERAQKAEAELRTIREALQNGSTEE